jgi:hypothetical protein
LVDSIEKGDQIMKNTIMVGVLAASLSACAPMPVMPTSEKPTPPPHFAKEGADLAAFKKDRYECLRESSQSGGIYRACMDLRGWQVVKEGGFAPEAKDVVYMGP